MSTHVRVGGFTAGSVACGIKENGKKDLSLIVSEIPAKAVGVFTTNAFQAAPVVIARARIAGGFIRALIVNSGNANAATGDEGIEDVRAVTRALAGKLAIDEEHILPASTGIIGHRLPVDTIIARLDELVGELSIDGIPSAEEGIMTTDAFPKMEYRTLTAGGKNISICGIAKGAGMIEPHMATLLSFVMTDADIETAALQQMFSCAVEKSFNAITVDGCMSTNDAVVMLANGYAGNRTLQRGARDTALFRDTLIDVMESLAKSVVKDGEGATKLIAIEVSEARTVAEAKKIAYMIANSNLVKTAFFGGDPNWGRIVSAVGASGITVSPDAVSVCMEDVTIFSGGKGQIGAGERLSDIMKRDTIRLSVTLGRGRKSFRLYTSDLSHEYVNINALYHT
ncbi:MAG: bifunctional glutamate N-acetyltransferase/amino-acid acetyltransferase ArgJ [Deltaproteobacteria bacterium]|nr:bifunctional glutamate N-acetyltransferase/amino-acid acetyltransferase ArgJ [Deltaproteobacteria bacterium]